MSSYVVTPYAAHLRVYEPLAVFPEASRTAWIGSAQSRRAERAAAAAEHRVHLAGLAAVPPVVAPERESDEAFVLTVDGAVYACPWQTRLRSWQALETFRTGLPDAVVEAFLPRVVAEQISADHERWRALHPEERPHILTSNWQVPLHWFAAFDPGERELRLSGPRTMVYRTRMSAARRRMARALRTLQQSIDGPATEGAEQVARWLEEFHPRSYVELDYGGLVHVLRDVAMVEDTSVADIGDALSCLRAGDYDGARQLYDRVSGRWQRVQALERAN